MNKRKISLAMSIVIFAGILASCGAQPSGGEVTTDSGNITETTEAETENKEISDDLPETNFEGKTFTVLTYDYIKDDYVVEEETGDVVKDAEYRRDQTVSERFGAKIEYIADYNLSDATNFVKTSVMAGDDAFQLVANHVVSMGTIATEGLFMNMFDLPYINFEKPWWSKSTVEDLAYGNDLVTFAIGDYALSALYGTYCYYYDKKVAQDYDFEDLYAVVNDGRWTIDYVEELCKPMYKDLNGNAEKDEDDFYGLTQSMGSPANAYFWAFGGKIFTRDNNGIPQYTYKDERTTTIFEKLYQLCYESDGINNSRPKYEKINASGYQDISAYSFRDDLSALASGSLLMTTLYLRDKKNEYGILPYPKLDESQNEYRTMVDGYHAILAVPKTIQDPDFVGIMTEALNAESHKQVFPAYYEVALKKKYTYDDESVKMLDMIVDSRVFDFGYVYDAWKGVSFYPEYMLRIEKSKDFESYYAKKSKASVKYYEKILDFFANFEK